nr:retrovirus-related Pol polyprotein from transposon TNT 1-94 [Tanacetum cinerariifolium]
MSILTKRINDMTKGKSEKGKKDKEKSEKGLLAESFDWDDESVSLDDEGSTKIRAFMAIVEDEPSVGKADARSGQWVDITMKKETLPPLLKLIGATLSGTSKRVISLSNLTPSSSSQSSSSKASKQKTWFGPCKHCGFRNHLYDDCYSKPKCSTCGSNDHLTKEHLEHVAVKKRLSKLKAQSHLKPSLKKAPMIPKPFIECKYYGFNDNHSDYYEFYPRVAYVNGLKPNLISISQLCDANYKVLFTKTQGTIYNQNDEVVLIAPRKEDVYVIDMSFLNKESNAKFVQKIYELSDHNDDIKEDDDPDDIDDIFKIEGNLFDFETPMCEAFNDFNHLLKINKDLFTFDIQETRTYEEYELNNHVTKDLKEPWLDNGMPYQLCDHIREPYRFKNGTTKWPKCSLDINGFCNDGELPGMVRVGRMTYFQDHKSYDKLANEMLKEETLMHKTKIKESWGNATPNVMKFCAWLINNFGNFHELDYNVLVKLQECWWKINTDEVAPFTRSKSYVHEPYANNKIKWAHKPYLEKIAQFNGKNMWLMCFATLAIMSEEEKLKGKIIRMNYDSGDAEVILKTLVPQDKWSREKHIELVNIIGDTLAGITTRYMIRVSDATSASKCLYVNFLFEMEPKKVIEALKEEGWIIVMQEELNQFEGNKVWTLVQKRHGKTIIRTKWIWKKDG